MEPRRVYREGTSILIAQRELVEYVRVRVFVPDLFIGLFEVDFLAVIPIPIKNRAENSRLYTKSFWKILAVAQQIASTL
jgi:hypothetical protein